jgi:hypothetical protein
MTAWAVVADPAKKSRMMSLVLFTNEIKYLSKFVGPYNSPESRDRYSPNEDPHVQLIQPEPNLKTPRKARIKEFGQATGQVISPSQYL